MFHQKYVRQLDEYAYTQCAFIQQAVIVNKRIQLACGRICITVVLFIGRGSRLTSKSAVRLKNCLDEQDEFQVWMLNLN